MIEDKKGEEFIRMHGEKDHNVTIRNLETWDIGEIFKPDAGSPSRETTLQHGDDKLTVKTGDQNIEIQRDQNVKIHRNQDVKIDQNQTINVGQKIDIKAGVEINLHVGSNKITIDNAGITINGMMVYIN
jgi:type VI secretion system secreted protein VgrG